jgi:enoyl-CoA hydratase
MWRWPSSRARESRPSPPAPISASSAQPLRWSKRGVSPGLAMSLILSGDAIDAQEALRIGLVQRVVPRPRLYAEAEALARQLMTRGPLAVRYAKEAVTRGLDLPLAEGLALEARLARLVLASRDAREGLRAKREGRVPRFVGV